MTNYNLIIGRNPAEGLDLKVVEHVVKIISNNTVRIGYIKDYRNSSQNRRNNPFKRKQQ